MYENKPENKGQHIEDLRAFIEHRALWLYYMYTEALKKGMTKEDAEQAIRNCGAFHGKTKYTQTSDLKDFSKEFAPKNITDIFQMDTTCTDEKFCITFHYCPLVAAWRKVTDDEKLIADLCDIAMCGDRGICSQFKDFEFELGDTIAKGADTCTVTFTKKK